MYLAILLVLLILYAAIAWRDLRLAIFLILACLPTYLLRLEILNIPTTFLELMFVIIGLFWIKSLWQKKINLDFKWLKQWLAPIFLLISAGLVGLLVAPDSFAALGIFKAYFLEPIILFVIIRTVLDRYDDAEIALKFLGFGAIAVALFAIYQHFTGLALPIPWDIERRATSFFPYPNAVGLYLGPIIVLGFCAFWRALETKFYLRAWFWILTLTLSTAAMIFSKTEAAWLAVPAALLTASLFVRRLRPLAILLIVPTIIIVFVFPNFRDKILLQDYSGDVRLKQWEETVNLLKDNWLDGVGLSGYPTALEPYHTHQEIEIFQYPHNLILNIWTELGLLGLVAAAAFIRPIKKHFNSTWLAFASVAALIEMIIHGLVDVPFFKNDLSMLTAAILALLSLSTAFNYDHRTVEQIEEE